MKIRSGFISRSDRLLAPANLLAMLLCGHAAADGTLTVELTGISPLSGEIGCSLFSSDAGFPMDPGAARQIWINAAASGARCVFSAVKSGTYAVSVAHDTNGNHRLDTNFIGLPLEQWGVSNNMRPIMRPPHFSEAAFGMPANGSNLLISVRVQK